MSMLTVRETEERGLTLADYEARIHLYREQIGTGFIGIGRTLNEAKAAQVVPHGEWESWVTRTTGLTPRQAQRCMQAAAEIRDGSALARLEMSKALLLLGSGLDEDTRETVAEKAAQEGATVKHLREEIRQLKDRQEAEQEEAAEAVKALKLQVTQEAGAAAEIRMALKKAESERDSLKGQLKDTISAYQMRLDEEAGNAYQRGLQDKAAGMEQDIRKEFQGKIDYINGERRRADAAVRELREQLKQAEQDGSARWDAGYKAGQEEAAGIRREADRLKRNEADLLEAAEAAEKRAADAEAELAALRAGGAGQPEPAWKVLKVAVTRFMTDCETMPTDPAALAPEQHRILANVERLEKWTDMMRMALAGVVPGEGAVK